MSASRLAARVSAAASLAILGACAAVWFFPLRSAAQVAPDDPGITVDAGAALAHRPPVRNPGGTTGDVLLELKLNSKGEVADARVLSGPDELRKSALASALEWHYLADTAPPSLVRATIHFGERSAALATAPPPPPPPPPPSAGPRVGAPPPPPPPPPVRMPDSAVVERIEYLDLSPELQRQVESSLPVREGDTLNRADWARLGASLRDIDEHLVWQAQLEHVAEPPEILLRILLRQGQTTPTAAPRGANGTPAPGTVMVGGAAMEAHIIQKVPPVYPSNARIARVEGTVQLGVAVAPDGRVQDVQLVSGPALLAQAAIDAVRQWVYQPYMLNGRPVAVQTTANVNFVLQ